MAVDQAKLDLQDKIDLANTLIGLQKRSEARWEKAGAKEVITDEHKKQIAEGRPTGVDFSSIKAGVLKALGSGETDGEG